MCSCVGRHWGLGYYRSKKISNVGPRINENVKDLRNNSSEIIANMKEISDTLMKRVVRDDSSVANCKA